ncbi:MAG: hypothetical protein GEV11_23310 [Streptosporangiales bacterium]|nr:hypothetical protein [Streptosporangiales bacterium]
MTTWLRFTEDVPVLLMIGGVALVLAVALPRLDPALGALVRWGSVRPAALLYGLGGGVPAAAHWRSSFSPAASPDAGEIGCGGCGGGSGFGHGQ